ncbi:hypothetical protein DFS34DRAFT_88095 [Phlyctochytrium arcticum]|nr:hypothetical protein DFS34DRAFT_88095 [Phlyctochytrium arcticum]
MVGKEGRPLYRSWDRYRAGRESTYDSTNGSLDDVQELCRARLDYLVDADDARKLQRTPFYKVALYRFPAILITLSLELVVAGIITSHKTATKGSPITKENEFLFSFAPVLSSMSGNIGLQASTTTLRALATGHASSKSLQDIMRVLLREFLCAFLIGLVSSCALIGIGDLWTQSVPFGLVTGMSLMVSASLGGIIGCSGPIIFKKLGIDPAVTAGPFETAVQDMISYSVYLGLARMFLYGT